MAIKSNVGAAMAEIDRQLRVRNEAAAIVAEGEAKKITPVGTPESTGIPNYRGGRLRSNVTHDSDETGFVVGVNVFYGKFVHNGTYDFRQDEMERLDSLPAAVAAVAAAEGATGDKGMRPRPFLVEGIVNASGEMRRIYGA